jgi:hypothetical protein
MVARPFEQHVAAGKPAGGPALGSAGGAVCLASQALYADLGEVSEGFRAQVLINANVTILHQQRNEEPAMWAEAIGTELGWKETLQVTDDMSVLGSQAAASGVGSLREADSFIVHPNVLRNLPRGHAVVLVGHPTRTITTVTVIPARGRSAAAPSATTAERVPPDASEPEQASTIPPSSAPTPAAAQEDSPERLGDGDTLDADDAPAVEPAE